MVWSVTRPSRRNTTRSAHEASWASWVTTTAARPRLHARVDQPHDRLAVGRVQRARRLVGQQQPVLADHGAGDGHPLPLAAGQLVGEVLGPVAQAKLLEASSGRPARAFLAGMPSSSSGSETFSAAVSPGSRLKSWNT